MPNSAGDKPGRRKDDTVDVRWWNAAALAVGVVTLGLFGCGSSGRQMASRGTDSAGDASVASGAGKMEEALRSARRAAKESEARAARRRKAFATFGEPASRAVHVVLVGELHKYYGLLADAQFGRACELLSKGARARIAKAAGNSGKVGEHECADRFAKMFAMTAPVRHGRPEFRVVNTKEVRLKGSEGYVVFTALATPTEELALSVVREGGRWRVASPIALLLADASPSQLGAETVNAG